MNIVITLLLTAHEAEQLDENFHHHWMTLIQGGFGWIPFQKQLMVEDIVYTNIDYEDINCYIPGITGKSADYMKFNFEFSDSSCKQLSNILGVIKPFEGVNPKKSTFRINESFNKCSLSSILNLIDSIPKT